MKRVILGLTLMVVCGTSFATDYCSQVAKAPLKYKATKIWNCVCSEFAVKNKDNDWVYNQNASTKVLALAREELQDALRQNNAAIADKEIAASPNSPKEVQLRIQNTIGVIDDILSSRKVKKDKKVKK
jgi:hypothetical protein